MSSVLSSKPAEPEVPVRPGKRSLLLSVLATIGLFLISQVAAGLLIGLIGIGLGHKPSMISDWIASSAGGQFGFILIAEGLLVGGVWLLAGRSREGLKRLGLKRPTRKIFKYAAGGFLAVYALLIIANIVISQLFPEIHTDQKQDIGFDHISTHSDVALTFVSLVILPPVAEETLVRGYLYSKLRSGLSFVPTLISTSLLFGAAHLQFGNGQPLLWSAAIDIFVLSLVLGYLREKTGNIWAGVLVHSLNNLVAFLVRFHGVIF